MIRSHNKNTFNLTKEQVMVKLSHFVVLVFWALVFVLGVGYLKNGSHLDNGALQVASGTRS